MKEAATPSTRTRPDAVEVGAEQLGVPERNRTQELEVDEDVLALVGALGSLASLLRAQHRSLGRGSEGGSEVAA
jgi:hypothetical protein